MPTRLYPATAVLAGHPDKRCDRVAEALVQHVSRHDPIGRCVITVTAQRSTVFVAGRLTGAAAASLDVDAIVRSVHAHPDDVKILTDLHREPGPDGPIVATGACIVTGYAIDVPGTNYLPPEQWLAARVARRLADRYPGADGRLTLLLEEEGPPTPTRLAGFSLAVEPPDVPAARLQREVREVLQEELQALAHALPGFDATVPEAVAITEIAGSDTGVSGRVWTTETYASRLALSGVPTGKDFYHQERAGAIVACRLAKAVVQTGAAFECRVTLACSPGQTEAQIIALDGDGKLLDASRWSGLIDRSLAGSGDRYTNRVDLDDVAYHGHFVSEDRPWEKVHFDPVVVR